MNKLVLIRGLPGSGKTETAKRLMADRKGAGLTCRHYEADDYFTDAEGNYNYIPEKAPLAHAQCYKNVTDAMMRKVNYIYVANTFVRMWEMDIYRCLAKLSGYELIIYECKDQFESIHGVPLEVIEIMKGNWETTGPDDDVVYVREFKGFSNLVTQ